MDARQAVDLACGVRHEGVGDFDPADHGGIQHLEAEADQVGFSCDTIAQEVGQKEFARFLSRLDCHLAGGGETGSGFALDAG